MIIGRRSGIALPKLNIGNGLLPRHLIDFVVDMKIAGIAVFVLQRNDSSGWNGHFLMSIVFNHGEGQGMIGIHRR